MDEGICKWGAMIKGIKGNDVQRNQQENGNRGKKRSGNRNARVGVRLCRRSQEERGVKSEIKVE